MPWQTPSLRDVRALVRDSINASLPGADALVPNSVLRVLSDNQGALCHAVLQYIDWLALQLLPDTAETEWLDRHGNIWLKNADGTTGRKMATLASGVVLFTGVNGTAVPIGTRLRSGDVEYETTEFILIGSNPTECHIRALDPGAIGNVDEGEFITLVGDITGADGQVEVQELAGGTDEENDNDLRARILFRIQQPPMGGDANDYVAWTLSVPGVTRAWAVSEMGVGTITVRFMMDELRADNGGFPTNADIATVTAYIDSVRPVAIKDRWVVAPIPEPIDFTIKSLVPDTDAVRAEIEVGVRDMLRLRAAPAQTVNGILLPATTIYAAWVSATIMETPTVQSFTLDMVDHPMPSNGSLGVLGTILYER